MLGVLAVVGAVPASAAPVIVNGDFSAGFTGWTLTGAGTTPLASSQGLPGIGNAARLDTNGNVVDQATAEAQFGLAAGALNPFNGPLPPGPPNANIQLGTTLFQDITSGLAGDTITFDAVWLAGDGNYDVALAILGDTFNLTPDQLLPVGRGGTGATPPQALSFTLGRNATVLNPLRFGFFVANTQDTAVSSFASFANVGGVNGAAAPELNAASAALPLSLSFISLMLLNDGRKRRIQS